MAAYPDLPTDIGSDPEVASGLDIERADDGTPWAYSLWASDRANRIKISHRLLDASQRSALLDHYAAHRLVSFDYTSPADSVTRTCIYARPPSQARQSGLLWDIDVELVEL